MSLINKDFQWPLLQFLGGWYEQRTVRVPLLQPSGMSCGYSIYGEDGTKDSIHEWHIQTMPKVKCVSKVTGLLNDL